MDTHFLPPAPGFLLMVFKQNLVFTASLVRQSQPVLPETDRKHVQYVRNVGNTVIVLPILCTRRLRPVSTRPVL